MFMVLLKPAAGRDRAPQLLAEHKAWLERGLEEGVFMLWGSLRPDGGGAILARGEDRPRLEERLAGDPFVAEGVVSVELVEIAPARAEPRLEFLLG